MARNMAFPTMRCMLSIAALLLASACPAESELPSADGSPGAAANAMSVAALMTLKDRIAPLFSKMGKPRPGDWLESHREPGQTFDEYIRAQPTRPGGERKTIYIQPMGDFTDKQLAIVSLTSEFMSRYFNLTCVVLEKLPLSIIPADAQRTHPAWGDRQIHAGYVLDHVLKPRLPRDAAACIALTASDLWPGGNWNFVFGQASLQERVAVLSIYRNGNPDGSSADFRLCLLRTLKTATHETGHMFGMEHCTAYECNMCGSNSRPEADRRPLALCPECVAKVWWSAGADPAARYRRLAEFCGEQGLECEQEFFRRLADRLLPGGNNLKEEIEP